MRVGKLRHRLTIKEPVSVRDSTGGDVPTWSTVATVWARISPLMGKEILGSGSKFGEITHKVVMRHRQGIVAKMRLQEKDRVFEIVSPPINIEELDKEIQIMVKELVD